MFAQRQLVPWILEAMKLGWEESKAELGPRGMKSDSPAGILSQPVRVPEPGLSRTATPLLPGLKWDTERFTQPSLQPCPEPVFDSH